MSDTLPYVQCLENLGCRTYLRRGRCVCYLPHLTPFCVLLLCDFAVVQARLMCSIWLVACSMFVRPWVLSQYYCGTTFLKPFFFLLWMYFFFIYLFNYSLKSCIYYIQPMPRYKRERETALFLAVGCDVVIENGIFMINLYLSSCITSIPFYYFFF